MTLGTAISRIRSGCHDLSSEYSREEIINFINTTLQYAASMLVSGGYHELVRTVTLENGDYLPKNFLRGCGNYPIVIDSGQVSFIDSSETTMEFRYFSTPENIAADATDNSELPFVNDALNEAIIRQATILALNQNEYNVQQDTTIYNAFQQAVAAAMNAG